MSFLQRLLSMDRVNSWLGGLWSLRRGRVSSPLWHEKGTVSRTECSLGHKLALCWGCYRLCCSVWGGFMVWHSLKLGLRRCFADSLKTVSCAACALLRLPDAPVAAQRWLPVPLTVTWVHVGDWILIRVARQTPGLRATYGLLLSVGFCFAIFCSLDQFHMFLNWVCECFLISMKKNQR